MGGKNILVIDDEPGIRLLLRKLFEHAGYTVSEAANALQVFSLDPHARYDAVVLDLRMPGIDGHKVLKSFKREPANSPPILVFTSSSSEVERRQALSEGADAYITKPGDNTVILATIAELIAKREKH
jgi:CheY-like chemotaxis protein